MNSTKTKFSRSWRPELRKVFPHDDPLAIQMFRLWVFREDVKAMVGLMITVKENKKIGVTVWAQRSVLFRHIAVAVYEGLSLLVPSPKDKDGVRDAAVVLAFIEEAKQQSAFLKSVAHEAEKHFPALESERKRMYNMRNKFGGAHIDIDAAAKLLEDQGDYAAMMTLANSIADTRYDAPSEAMISSCLDSVPATTAEFKAAFLEFAEGFRKAHDAILHAVNHLIWLYAIRQGLVTGFEWKTP
jgi:hypothetical protein